MKLSFLEQKPAWVHIRDNWLIRLVGRAVLFLNIAAALVILIRFTKLPLFVPLWYSRPWGTDQLASPLWLFILPVGSIFLHIINLAISIFFTAEYLVFTQMIFLTSFLVSLLSFITLIKIVFLIT